MGTEASQSGSPFVFPFSKSAGSAEVTTGRLPFPLGDSDRAGKEGMGDELGGWLGRFRALNLGTTATLTLRRGMFFPSVRDMDRAVRGTPSSATGGNREENSGTFSE